MRYQLICLDAGFTLIEPRQSQIELLATFLAEDGIQPTPEAFQKAWKIADQWFWEEYHRPDNRAWSSDAHIRAVWRNYHRLMLQELGFADSHHHLIDMVIDVHDSPVYWQPYADVLPALAALQQRGLKLGVVSDWSTQLPGILEAVGLLPYMDFVLVSAAAGAAKPMAQFFLKALDLAQVAPDQALMVGDSYHGDVGGARAAGMDAVLLDRAGTATATDVRVVRSLVDILPLL